MNCAPGEVCHVDSPAMRLNRVLFWVSVVIYAGAVTLHARGTLVGCGCSHDHKDASEVWRSARSSSVQGPPPHRVTGRLRCRHARKLGRGGWSVDQAWTLRAGNEDERRQMLKTMLSFGITENLQISGSFPLAMSDGRLAPAR